MNPPRSEVALRFQSAEHSAAFLAQSDAMVKVLGPVPDAAVEVIGDDVVIAVETGNAEVAQARAVAVSRAVCEGSDVPVPDVAGTAGWPESI